MSSAGRDRAFSLQNNGGVITTLLYGNVGIGTTSPGVPLQVNGQIKSNSLSVYGTGTTFLDKGVGYVESIAWFGPMNSSISGGLEVYLRKDRSGTDWTSTSVYLGYKVDASYFSYLRFANSGVSISDLSVNGQLNVNGDSSIGGDARVNGTVKASLFTTQVVRVDAVLAFNAFNITIPFPASYIFSVNGNGGSMNNGSGDGYTKAVIYVSIGAGGTITTTYVQSVGVQINSYNTTTQQLSYNIGYPGVSVNGGGVCTVSVLRLV